MPSPELKAEAALPVLGRPMRIRVYENGAPDDLVVALIHHQDGADDWPLVRIHSQCLTGDTLGSLRCDCGPQLRTSLEAIAEDQYGILIYVPSHEGRGIGFVNKIRAYGLQDEGLDTVEANIALCVPVDPRRYDAAVAVLADLGVSQLRLLTNNPRKLRAARSSMDVVRVPMPAFVTDENRSYLETKRAALGHLLPESVALPDGAPLPAPMDLGHRRRAQRGLPAGVARPPLT